MYSHILIPTDGSELAQKGVDHGLSLAKMHGSKVTILNVSDPFPPYSLGGEFGVVTPVTDFEGYRRSVSEHATRVLNKVKTEAAKMAISAETVFIEEMRPVEAIVDVANKRNCALIVMASHGRGGLGRLFLGSQTIEVLTHSSIPVLVVR